MMPRRKKWIIRVILISTILPLTLAIVLASLIIYQPLQVATFATKRIAPSIEFNAQSIHWTSKHSILIENAEFGSVLKLPRLSISWNWWDLMKGNLEELKLDQAQFLIDLSKIDKTFNLKGSKSKGIPWLIKRLAMERSVLTLVGMGPETPPLEVEVDGVWLDIPLGENLSLTELQKKRSVNLYNLAVHSPLDPSVTILTIEKIKFDFTYKGIKAHELDLLLFEHPIIKVDRGLFWFMESLRQANEAHSKTANLGSPWIAKQLTVIKGELDVTRLETLYVNFSWPFQMNRQDFPLKNLSLADSQMELDIPHEDMFWPSLQMHLVNVHGKIRFNAGESKTEAGPLKKRPPAGLANTLFIDKIIWKEMEIKESWMSLVFDKDQISSTLGGSFSDGYLNGGMALGWNTQDPWQFWGSAADIDTGKISNTFNNESFAMNGRAELLFNVKGDPKNTQGDIRLKSLSPGAIELRMADDALDRIEKNVTGIKKEALQIFIKNLRNYPYEKYSLNAHYMKPDAILLFESHGKLGSRKLDLTYHGLQNDDPR